MDAGAIARIYRWLEFAAFGRTLERARFQFVDRLRNARRVLVFGEGDGRMLEQMLRAAPEATFDIVEESAEMIALAVRRIAPADGKRVRFLCTDARVAELGTGYDAIATSFFLDCLDEVGANDLICRASGTLSTGGLWLVSEFAVPPSGWRRWHAALWVGVMYRFFGFATGLTVRRLPPFERLLNDHGLRCIDQTSRRAGLIVSQVWQKS